ncbi:MAG: MauE/DoxX family redox-associated membrane protein [Desulfuromonadales bacterium]|nr:MauE/DoxX family redox-associated membrane protein [Desulfuromonadales bacterium]
MTGWHPPLFHLCRLLLAAVFLYAGWSKSVDLDAFAGQIAAYQVLPYAGNYLVAATLPTVELLAGLLLLFNLRIRPALVVIGGLLLVFMAALVSLLWRGLEIDCGCFAPGTGEPVSAWLALWRDVGLCVLVVLCWWLRSRLVRSGTGPASG